MRWLYHVVVEGDGAWALDPLLPGPEGFVHCSYRDAVVETARLYFPKGAKLCVLQIDPRRVGAPIDEADTPRGKMPHVLGPIPEVAVRAKLTLAEVSSAPDALDESVNESAPEDDPLAS